MHLCRLCTPVFLLCLLVPLPVVAQNPMSGFPAGGIQIPLEDLLFDDGRLVPSDNKVEVGQKVNLRLIIEGWDAADGKVMLGASERISTDEGSVLLDEEDLFCKVRRWR